jgi:hypothetical protein
MNAQVKPQETIRVLDDITITQFNDTNVSLLAKDIEKQLAVIAARYGITLNFSLGKTTTNTIAARLSGYIAADAAGTVNPNWKASYMRLCHLIGLTPDDYGKHVYNMNLKKPEKESYEIVGMTPKSLDLIIRTPSDRFYRLPMEEAQLIDAVPAPVIEQVEEPVTEAIQSIAKALDIEELEEDDLDSLDLDLDNYDLD